MFCAIEEPAGLLFELGQQVVPGVGGLAGGHFFGCAGNDQRAAAVATFRAEVNYVVGGFYHVEVMLDYHHCVAVGYEPQAEDARGMVQDAWPSLMYPRPTS